MTDIPRPATPLPLTASEQGRRGRRFGWWYVAEYELRSMRASAWSIALYAIGMPLLYMIAMGVGLGSLVNRNSGVGGVSYLVFVAPASMLSTITLSAAAETSWPVMRGFKWARLYEAPQATTVRPAQIGLGHLLAVLIRFALQAGVFWLVMVVFGAATSGWSWLTVPIAVLTAASFGAPIQAYSATLRDEGGAFNVLQRFIIMPLTLFSGTYFPLATMPGYVQWIGWISPLWHGTQLARWASYSMTLPGWLAAVHLLVLVTFAGVGVALVARNYTRRLAS